MLCPCVTVRKSVWRQGAEQIKQRFVRLPEIQAMAGISCSMMCRVIISVASHLPYFYVSRNFERR